MNLNEAIANFVNQQSNKERKIGRYWPSEIYRIKKGYLKPQDFFKQREIDARGVANISQGIAGEDYIHKALEANSVDMTPQLPFEIKISDDITMAGKVDFHLGKYIFEVKAPATPLTELPEKYKDQLEAYYQAFRLPVYLCEVAFNPFSTILWSYTPEKGRWEEDCQAIIEFDKELRKLNK